MNPGARLLPGVLIPVLLLVPMLAGLAGCRTGGRDFLPVKITEPIAGPGHSRSAWPARDMGAARSKPDAVEAAAKVDPTSQEALPPLSDNQWRAEAERVLDDWHLAAARGDRNRYLGHMSLDAVFMGTDAEERWDIATFTAYVDRHFKPGAGWTYYPFERHVTFSAAKEIAWFDEKLNSPGYGALRGTGVLRRLGSTWKIVHYSMTFLVPNGETARAVVDIIREGGAAPVR